MRELDPTAPDTVLRRFWELEQAAHRADREHPVLRGWESFVLSARAPSSHTRHVLLVAEGEGGDIRGVADLTLTRHDNLHLAELDLAVDPEHRRQGVGRALHDHAVALARADGRTTFLAEVHRPMETGSPGHAFATALGYRSVHHEHHLVLPLPAEPPRREVPGWELLAWSGPVPEALRADYVAMRTQMERDVPLGGVDYEPQEVTLADLDEQEWRMAVAYDWVTAVARAPDGVLAGYSLVYVPHDTPIGWQDDTLVMPVHRGRGLGAALKHATFEVLRREHPRLEALHTWTDPDNHAMYETNRRFGYLPVERMDEMQRQDAR